MITCRECGYRNEGRKTCKRCGASLEFKNLDDASVLDDLPDMTRYEINKELKKMLKHFASMEPQYNEYEYCNQKLDFFDKRGYVPAAIPIYGIITIAISAFFIVMICLKSFKLYNMLILWMLMYVALGVYCVVAFRKSLKENRRNIKKFQGRAVELAKQLTNAVNDYGPMIIDAKYTDPRIIERLMVINRSGRTDTLEQAIDMLYHESGRTKDEDNAYLDKLTSRQAEFGDTTAKVFCSANFFGLYHKDEEPEPFK